MVIKYQLTFEDMLAFQKNVIKNVSYHKKRSKIFWGLLILFVLFLVTTITGIVLPPELYFTNFSLYAGVSIGTGTLAALGSAPFLKKSYAAMALWQYRSFARRSKNRKWPRMMTLTINAKGIQVSSEESRVQGNVQIDWKAIYKVNENQDCIYLYIEENDAIIIPKRHRATSLEEWVELHKTLERYLDIPFQNLT